jgi:hypothetical protein
MSSSGSLNIGPENFQKNGKSIEMKRKQSYWIRQLLNYGVKQPGIYLLILTGILVDFLVQFPFMVVCSFENLIRKIEKP